MVAEHNPEERLHEVTVDTAEQLHDVVIEAGVTEAPVRRKGLRRGFRKERDMKSANARQLRDSAKAASPNRVHMVLPTAIEGQHVANQLQTWAKSHPLARFKAARDVTQLPPEAPKGSSYVWAIWRGSK